MRAPHLLLALALVPAVFACDSVPDTFDDGVMIVAPIAMPRTAPGQVRDVPITIERNDYDKAVELTFTDLPDGIIVVAPAMLGVGELTGTISLRTSADVTIGVHDGAHIVAAAPGLDVLPLPTSIIVAGDRGTLDTTFLGSGAISFAVSSTSDELQAVLAQPDGKLLLGGTALRRWVVVRLLDNGMPDPSFGVDGRFISDAGDTGTELRAMAFALDGGLLLAGSRDGALTVARLSADGDLDTSFGGPGGTFALTAPAGFERSYARAVHQEPTSGTIVVAGAVEEADGDPFAVVVGLSPNGKIDPALGDDAGVTIAPYSSSYNALVYDPRDRSYFAVGTDTTNGQDASSRFYVRQHAATLTPMAYQVDDGWDDGGYYYDADWCVANASALDAEQRLVLAGSCQAPGTEVLAIRRIADDDITDVTNPDQLQIGEQASQVHITAIVMDPLDDAMWGIAYADEPTGAAALFRYGADGNADLTFGTDGFVSFGTIDDGDAGYRLNALTRLADGRLVAVGHIDDGGFFVTRVWD